MYVCVCADPNKITTEIIQSYPYQILIFILSLTFAIIYTVYNVIHHGGRWTLEGFALACIYLMLNKIIK